MKKAKLITLIVGLFLIISSFMTLFIYSIPTLGEKTFTFRSHYKEDEVTLSASLYETKDAEYGLIICPGYSCDRQKWRPMATAAVKNGLSVMTFDYSGQGSSYGKIGFDNAKTDAIPVEIDDAIETFHNKTSIDYDRIILLGHSMGGRAILRLMYDYNEADAVTTVNKKDIRNIILFSPEVNYSFNAQASLFAGTSDDTDPLWSNFTEKSINGTNVYLFGSTADDIVSDENVLAIYSHLGATNIPQHGQYNDEQINNYGSKITIGITGGILHSYQMYSSIFANYLNSSLKSITGNPSSFKAWTISSIYIGWGLALGGLFLTLFSLNLQEKAFECSSVLSTEEEIPEINNYRKWLGFKLLMWIPGIIVAFLLCCICMVFPLGSPIMNIPYMCFIAGYGITMLIHYSKGRFKGTIGKIAKPSFKIMKDKKSILHGVGVLAVLCLFVWSVLWTSMYRLIPFNSRWFWLVLCTVLMTIGYYISSIENDALKKQKANKKIIFLYNVIQYIPLFLFVGFYAAIGSFSGFIGQMQNMVLMYIFCVPMGNLIQRCFKNRFYGALITALLFQTLMITSAALISMF